DSHPDFGKNAAECTKTLPDDQGGETVPANVLTTGLVQTTLGPNGKPQLVGATGTQECGANTGETLAKESYVGITQFDDWFTDGSHVVTVPDTLVLFDNGSEGFVNRFTAEGDKFPGYEEGSEVVDPEGDLVCSWC